MTNLVIYDALGRKAATLVSEKKEGGNYSVSFDGPNLASGIYYAQLTSGGKMQVRKTLMLKEHSLLFRIARYTSNEHPAISFHGGMFFFYRLETAITM